MDIERIIILVLGKAEPTEQGGGCGAFIAGLCAVIAIAYAVYAVVMWIVTAVIAAVLTLLHVLAIAAVVAAVVAAAVVAIVVVVAGIKALDDSVIFEIEHMWQRRLAAWREEEQRKWDARCMKIYTGWHDYKSRRIGVNEIRALTTRDPVAAQRVRAVLEAEILQGGLSPSPDGSPKMLPYAPATGQQKTGHRRSA